VAEPGDGGQRGSRHGGGRGWTPIHDDPAHPRLFFAVPIPAETRAAVASIAERVEAEVADGRSRIRWVRMDGLHLTLRFLGPTPLEAVPALIALTDAAAAATPPVAIELGGAGAFPSVDHPRTLWVGLRAGEAALQALARTVETGVAVATGGLPLETRPFAPHLTIARTDGVRNAPAAAQALVAAAAGLAAAFTADEIVLYRSFLGEGPARYEPVHAARLTGAGDGR